MQRNTLLEQNQQLARRNTRLNQTRRGRTTHSTLNTSRAHPRRHTAITHQHVAHGTPTGQKSSRHGMAWRRAKRSTEQSLAHSTRTPCNPIVTVQDRAQGDTRLEQNRQAAWQSTPEHKTWQWQTRITHPQLVAEQYRNTSSTRNATGSTKAHSRANITRRFHSQGGTRAHRTEPRTCHGA